MKGLMMDFQLTLPTILKRAETYFPHQEIVTRMPDRSFHRYSFADFGKKQALHMVVLDDSLSMNDEWIEAEATKNSFQVATKEILLDKIAKAVSHTGSSDKLVVLPLSKLDDPIIEHERLNVEFRDDFTGNEWCFNFYET